MRKSKIKQKLNQGEAALTTTLHFTDAAVYELASLLGFDGIWMDLEHHGTSLETAGQLMRAARVGDVDIVARPAKGEFMRIGRILELGATAILYPRCDDAKEAAEVVRWAKFAPQGTRGVDSAGADNPYLLMPLVEYLQAANEQTLIIIQLEDESAVQNASAIAAVDGVDALFFGPGDYSILSGIPGQWDHPKLRDARQRVADAALAAGKHWGMPVSSSDAAQELIENGLTPDFSGL